MLVRSDSKEPLLARKSWNLFRTVVVCIYICRYNSVRFSRLEGIFHTSFRRRKILYSYGRATTQYVVASKDCKNPEAAFKIINYLIANEQTW